jgi:hypothetical protein
MLLTFSTYDLSNYAYLFYRLKRNQEIEKNHKTEIWQSIKIDDCDREQLIQLKELVASTTGTKVEGNTNEHLSSIEVLSLLDKSYIAADIGGNVHFSIVCLD